MSRAKLSHTFTDFVHPGVPSPVPLFTCQATRKPSKLPGQAVFFRWGWRAEHSRRSVCVGGDSPRVWLLLGFSGRPGRSQRILGGVR